MNMRSKIAATVAGSALLVGGVGVATASAAPSPSHTYAYTCHYGTQVHSGTFKANASTYAFVVHSAASIGLVCTYTVIA